MLTLQCKTGWIYSVFLNCAEQCVPHYEATIRPRDKHFMNSNIRTLMRKKDRLYKILKQTQDQNVDASYKQYRNLVVSEVRKCKREHDAHLDNMISSGDVSNATWWKACKHSLGKVKKPTEGPLRANGRLITEDRENANLHIFITIFWSPNLLLGIHQ